MITINLIEYVRKSKDGSKKAGPVIVVAGGIKSGKTAIANYIQDMVSGAILDVKEFYDKHLRPHTEDMSEQERGMLPYSQYFHFLKIYRAKDPVVFSKKVLNTAEVSTTPMIVDGFDNYEDVNYFLSQAPNNLLVFVKNTLDYRAHQLFESNQIDGIDSVAEAREKIKAIDHQSNVFGIEIKCRYSSGVVVEANSLNTGWLNNRLDLMMKQLQQS